ncbi:hypothetical protein [Levilactobacillus wangkuiensis]|uniref:hypothetical protein n=1 Tax=Levilactobacillus wangkuiensis TaxID=2799566 RepID=UPI001941A57C|nr:hypothetical protein [Levilactobacillus wangkuiensis]
MKKVKLVTLIATTILGVSAFTPLIEPIQTAQASSWHKGTPKAIRGKWKMKNESYALQRIHITKTHLYYYSAGPYYLKNISYKKTGKHSYTVRGYEYTYLYKQSSVYFKIKSHKIIKFNPAPSVSKTWYNTYHRR